MVRTLRLAPTTPAPPPAEEGSCFQDYRMCRHRQVSCYRNRRLEAANNAVLHTSLAWELGVYTSRVRGATLVFAQGQTAAWYIVNWRENSILSQFDRSAGLQASTCRTEGRRYAQTRTLPKMPPTKATWSAVAPANAFWFRFHGGSFAAAFHGAWRLVGP